jgi:hypothetical protein
MRWAAHPINLTPHDDEAIPCRPDELVKCDGIALLPDWHLSRGALLEHHIARSLDMHVFVAAEITIHPHDPVLAEASA